MFIHSGHDFSFWFRALDKSLRNTRKDALLALLQSRSINVAGVIHPLTEQTPLHVIAESKAPANHHRVELVKLLLGYGADPSLKDADGNAAIDLLVGDDQEEIAELKRLLSFPGMASLGAVRQV